jgi:CDP-paratose 2-epimerase
LCAVATAVVSGAGGLIGAESSAFLPSSTLRPRVAAVDNMGGGRASNCSMLEAIELCEGIAGRSLDWSLADGARLGDHRWWISDLAEFQADDPAWSPKIGVEEVLTEIYEQNVEVWTAEVPAGSR